MSKWFAFNQNNSGGRFDHDVEAGIGICVWIQAEDAGHANYRAKHIGLYFDGCTSGRDCDCCGDRWSEAHGDEGTDQIVQYKWPEGEVKLRSGVEGEEPFLEWEVPSYIHPLVGGFSFATRSEYGN